MAGVCASRAAVRIEQRSGSARVAEKRGVIIASGAIIAFCALYGML
jgi:hypothetical protein